MLEYWRVARQLIQVLQWRLLANESSSTDIGQDHDAASRFLPWHHMPVGVPVVSAAGVMGMYST